MAPSVIVVGGGRKSLLSAPMSSALVCSATVPFRKRLTSSLPVSGLSAAHTIYLAGGNVTVLDKQGKPIPHSPPSLPAAQPVR